MLTSVSNGMTLNALSDHSLPRFHFRLEACWTKASTLWQWCCSWQEPPTYQLEDLQRKIKLFWTLNFIVLTEKNNQPKNKITKKKKAKEVNTFKSIFTISKKQCSGFKYFTKDFILSINNVKNKFTYAVSDAASHLQTKHLLYLWKLILPLLYHSSYVMNLLLFISIINFWDKGFFIPLKSVDFKHNLKGVWHYFLTEDLYTEYFTDKCIIQKIFMVSTMLQW